MWNIGGYGFGRDHGKANGNENGNSKENGSEKQSELSVGTSNRDKTENEAECRTGDHSKTLTTLQSDVFLQGHQHTPNSYLSTFFDFPTNNQLLMCYINSGFICWRFEHKPSKSFAIPSLQIYPFPVTNENSGSLQPANHVLMITFISGSTGKVKSISTVLDSTGTIKVIMYSGPEKYLPESVIAENSYRLGCISPFQGASLFQTEQFYLATVDSTHQVDLWKRNV